MRAAIAAVFLALSAPLTVQSAEETAGQPSEADAFRARLAEVPVIPFDRVELDLQGGPSLGRVRAVSTDLQGNFYVFHRAIEGDPITVFGPDGRFLRSWGAGLFNMPHGIRFDTDGNVWTVDANTSRIFKFSPTGDVLLEIQLERPPLDREFCGATDLAFLADGHVVVSDGYCNGRVVELDPEGNQVGGWGTRGKGPGQFRVAHGIAVGPGEVIYVADRENGRLQRFDRSGRLLGIWEYARQLYSVVASRNGELYISLRLDSGYSDSDNHVVRIDPQTGDMLGRFQIDCIGHELAISANGALVPGLLCKEPLGHVVLYRRR